MIEFDTAIEVGQFHSTGMTVEQSLKELGVKQRVFGVLVELGTNGPNKVIHYRSDFYHDAMWLDANIVEDAFIIHEADEMKMVSFVFYFNWDAYGTILASEKDYANHLTSRANLVKCTVELVGGKKWEMRVTAIRGVG